MKSPSTKQMFKHLAPAYVTKRLIVSASRLAGRLAADRAMQTVGYVIKAKDGWIIRQNMDGSASRIKKYRIAKRPINVILD